jgi:hypothetical protein
MDETTTESGLIVPEPDPEPITVTIDGEEFTFTPDQYVDYLNDCEKWGEDRVNRLLYLKQTTTKFQLENSIMLPPPEATKLQFQSIVNKVYGKDNAIDWEIDFFELIDETLRNIPKEAIEQAQEDLASQQARAQLLDGVMGNPLAANPEGMNRQQRRQRARDIAKGLQ